MLNETNTQSSIDVEAFNKIINYEAQNPQLQDLSPAINSGLYGVAGSAQIVQQYSIQQSKVNRIIIDDVFNEDEEVYGCNGYSHTLD